MTVKALIELLAVPDDPERCAVGAEPASYSAGVGDVDQFGVGGDADRLVPAGCDRAALNQAGALGASMF